MEHRQTTGQGLWQTLRGWLRPASRSAPRRAGLPHAARVSLQELSLEDLGRVDWRVAVPLSVHVSPEARSRPGLDDLIDAIPSVPDRFLGVVSPAALVHVLELAGILDRLASLGYDVRLRIEIGHPLGDRVVIVDPTLAGPLCDLRLHRARRPLPRALADLGPPDVMELLEIEWLSMQHPRGRFSARRPRLPGQEHPGLGLGRRVADLLELAARRLGVEGVLNRPRYYHNAELYAARFHYLDPVHEGWLVAARRDLEPVGLAARSWLFERRAVRRRDPPEPVVFWEGEQVMPIAPRLVRGFAGRRYRSAVRAAAAARFEASHAR
jgi:hypothetical protein